MPARSAQRYQIKERIARGGMGEVYRAFDSATGETVALKRVVVEDQKRMQLFVSAFEREYQVLASLDHPRIIRVYDYGVDGEGPYYTMELARGRDLNTAAPLPWREVCLVIRDVASSLALLHARRLLHRDLSPKNVKVGSDGHGKLLDFGALAAFGPNRTLVGTAPLVAPEVLRGEPLDQRADLYALGALTYWSLTGKHAFPAPNLSVLESYWDQPPLPPSSYARDVPPALDRLVLSLLSATPLARPSSAAEVIARLTAIGELPPDAEADQRRIAHSFLIAPPFVGRDDQLRVLTGQLRASREERGSAYRIEASAGSGRTRLLEEIGVRAQLAGTTVLRVDASMHPQHNGTTRALALRLLDALPDLARECARRHIASINALGREVETRLGLTNTLPPQVASESPNSTWELSEWLCDVARHRPLMVAIDNVEACDAASTGTLVSLAQRAPQSSLFLVMTERTQRTSVRGLSLLRARCQTMPLANLTPQETEALARGLFGEAPHVERFAEWLHDASAGSPLHCVEISRQLIEQDVIQHDGGLWSLPATRPQVVLPAALEDVLSIRIARLGPAALELAQLLSLQRAEPTLELCTALVGPEQASALALLDELARAEILHSDVDGYRFVSAALRDALLASMDASERERAHRRLGLVFAASAGEDPEQRMQAGWHLMRGGEELRGAELVAATLHDERMLRSFVFDGSPIGPTAEAALAVFKQHRRSSFERQPLLTALAVAAFFEDRAYATRYADEILDQIEQLAGLATARKLQRWMPRMLATLLALLWARISHALTPRAERPLNFRMVIRYTATAIVPIVGAAAVTLDGARAERVARVVQPWAALSRKTSLCAVYEVCLGLAQIARENQTELSGHFEGLRQRLANRRWYQLLPDDARALLIAASHFAPGAFATMRADEAQALESIAVLENSGVKLYGMVGAQLRWLMHSYRCELAQAQRYRARVEVYAAQVGSAWQVELWEPAALMPLYLLSGDMVAMSQTVRRFDELVAELPSLRFYHRLGRHALELLRHEGAVGGRALVELLAVQALFQERAPRSFVGWAATAGWIAAVYNRFGRHQDARDFCAGVLSELVDGDRDYTLLYLDVELQTALADLGLGAHDAARARIDGLLARYQESNHALCLGSLHEVRARIAYACGDLATYRDQLLRMMGHFLPTGYPPLIAKCERVAALEQVQAPAPAAGVQPDTTDLTTSLER